MRRNCSKLVTLVGTSPVSSSSSLSSCSNICSGCCFARRTTTVSRNVHASGASVCKCCSLSLSRTPAASPVFSSHHDEHNNTTPNSNNYLKSSAENSPLTCWKPVQYSSWQFPKIQEGVASTGMWKCSFLHNTFSLLHPRKCSTTSLGNGTGVYSFSKRNYCSNRNKNHNCNHLHQRNNSDDASNSMSQSCSVYENTNNNAQTRWSSSSSEYCSTTNVNNDDPNSHFLSSPSPSSITVGGRLAKNCGGNSNSSGGGGSSSSISSTSSSSSSVSSSSPAPVFGIMTTASSTNFTPVRTVVTSQRLVEVTRDSIMEQPKLLSKEEREEFVSVYHQLVKELLEIPDMKDMEETNRWMSRVLQYNVPHGKRNRGLSTALAYKYLAPEELTEDNVRLSYVLGWCVEILQAFFLVSDDIMDESETRRGRPCWYKVDNLGLAAVNDALLLEASIYAILRKHFSDKPYYARVMEVMHDVTYKTIFGQSLDTRTGQDRRMETYTMDRYSSIVKYKTSYYSFYLPVALAMTMCELTDPILFQQMRKVTLEMGHFFQVQDDYLDCFGDEEVTGKIGTDIQDCKCSWLFVVANQMCSAEQKKKLLDNYGKHNPEQVGAVKTLYKELGMEDVYHNYEEQTYNMICTHIQQMNDQLPKGLFYDMLHKIYKRNS